MSAPYPTGSRTAPIKKQKRIWRLSQRRDVFVIAGAIQLGTLVLSSMLLGGAVVMIFIPAALAHWLWAGWLIATRRHALTRADIIMMTAGFFLWVVVAFLMLFGLLLIDQTLNA